MRRREANNGPMGKGCLVLFFGVFAIFGIGFSLFFVSAFVNVARASSWVETPCVVLESKVERHDGDEGDTFSVFIRYRYEFEGQEHISERYQFLGISSSGYKGKKEIVDRLRKGTKTVCYVNPNDPSSAVINRSMT